MNHKLLNLITSYNILIVCYALLVFDEIHLCSSSFDWYATCSKKYSCGEIEAEFPFWGNDRPNGCGYPGLELGCEKKKATITIREVKYQVLELNEDTQILTIARADFSDGICSPKYGNTSLDAELFEYAPVSSDITLLYGCSSEVNFVLPNEFKCSNGRGFVLIGNPGSNGAGFCRSVVTVRVPTTTPDFSSGIFNVSLVEKALEEGFPVKYKVDTVNCQGCKDTGGVCGYDTNLNQTTCYCPNNRSISGLTTCSSTSRSGSQVEAPADGIPGTIFPGYIQGSFSARFDGLSRVRLNKKAEKLLALDDSLLSLNEH